MHSGEGPADDRIERSLLDAALDDAEQALSKMISLLEAGNLDQLNAVEKISFWQRFEAFRNRLPLIDHHLIADAEATDLAGERCSSTLPMLLTRMLQLSPGEAAARIRAAGAVGPRAATDGEASEPVLPALAAAQRDGAVSTEQVQIVARAMQRLDRPDVDPDEVTAAEQQLTNHARDLGPKELQRLANQVVNAIDRDGPAPVEDQLQ